MGARRSRARRAALCPLVACALIGCGGVDARPAAVATASSSIASTSPAAPACPPGAIRVAGGEFAESKRGRRAVVGALCVGAHEVTVDEYARCVAERRCAPAYDSAAWPLADEGSLARASEACNARHEGRGAHPVNCVDWSQADGYCAFVGMRLPTDEEWEWVARGGARGTAYPWGDDPPTAERVCAARDSTCAIGASAGVIAEAAAARDAAIAGLLGNVWEWTSSYADAQRRQRSFRGGGFSTPLDGLARWPRSAFPEQARTEVIGVRCVRAALTSP